MTNALNTKFGKAKLNDNGYYQIVSIKEGNFQKVLHRLIFEDFYNLKIPKGFVVHHKNKNKQDNCILNLQLLSKSEHTAKHNLGNKYNQGNKRTHKTKLKISKARNTTGYYRVSKEMKPTMKKGYLLRYNYYDENMKPKSITSATIEGLKEKVINKGLKWEKIEEN